ncbi:MAG: hypothetical protein L3J84_00765 [Gammaproteobacteria bacterium]|nr:hypothetical protein [Gammaproteobacteria bacterium]
MSDIKVTNNTAYTIHVAMSWKGIIQYYKNDLAPGRSYNFDKFGIGGSDFTAVVSAPNSENKFNHDADALNILGLVGIGAGAVVAVAGLILIPVTAGVSSGASLAAVGMITALSAGTAVAGAAVALGGIILEGIDGVIQPATYKGLAVSDKYELSVGGGDLIGLPKSDENGNILLDDDNKATLIVSEIKPLTVAWKNLTWNSSGSS